MSSMTISGIVFVCIFGGTLFGVLLRLLLPQQHLSAESKSVVNMAMGLVGTMTALVLGLLIASAKNSFDAQRTGLAQLSANVIVLDRALAHYGPETTETRAMLRTAVADLLLHTWPQETAESGHQLERSGTEGRYEGIYEKILELTPKNDTQRSLQAMALKSGADIAQTRWLMFCQKGSSIPTPFLVLMVCWLTLILASFSLFAPPNATVFVTLLVCSLAVTSAIYLILELDRPFEGMIQISSSPLRNTLVQLGK